MKSIYPSSVRGTVTAPPSKSMTVRAIAAASLSSGEVEITNPSSCDDALQAISIAHALGSEVVEEGDRLIIRKAPDRPAVMRRILDCGESGLCMRMFTPIAALSGEETVLTASGSLAGRPMAMVEVLNGNAPVAATSGGYAPVTVKGPLKGGIIEVDGSVTSQFLTGLLMALPLVAEDSAILVSRLASTPYVDMTLSLLGHFGVAIDHDKWYARFLVKGGQAYRPAPYRVEGDWSAAAFLLVAGAIAGEVTVRGLDSASFQADRAILEALFDAAARLTVSADTVKVEQGELKSFAFNATHAPDLFPPLVALASACPGVSVIHGVERLRHKESDRAYALASEFGKLGIAVTISGDMMEVRGGTAKGAVTDSHNDHRIAMACAVAGLRAEGPTIVRNGEAVSKSYPLFFQDLASLREGI